MIWLVFPGINKKFTRRRNSERELLYFFYAVRFESYIPNAVKYRKTMAITPFKSFKVTDFGTNRKIIYDFLLVIHIILPLTLHRFWYIALDFDRSKIANFATPLAFNPPPTKGIPMSYHRKWYVAKTRYFVLHFCRTKFMYIFTTFTQCATEATEFVEITQSKGHYAVQGHWRSLILAPIESSCATSY